MRLALVVGLALPLCLPALGCSRGRRSPSGSAAGAGAGGAAATTGAPGTAHLARAAIPPGWTEQSHAVYDRKTIFDYIDGGADRFLKKGFRRLLAARYVNAAKDELTVDLYDQGTAANATAIFADSRVPKPRPVSACDGALAHDYGLQLRVGAVYGEITVPRVDPKLQEAAVAFAKAVCGK
jgi:hypothetical protein